jgi:hypothetical protein
MHFPDNYEFVTCGQHVKGIPGENAPSIRFNPYDTVESAFSLLNYWYIRDSSIIISPDYTVSTSINTKISRLCPEVSECFICLAENVDTYMFYKCIHRICPKCHRACIKHGHIECCMCKAGK